MKKKRLKITQLDIQLIISRAALLERNKVQIT